MALPCPERDAIEALQKQSAPWPKDKASRLRSDMKFYCNGERIHLLGVSNGASMRRNPNLHIVVFGTCRSTGRRQNLKLLPQCRFGALVTGSRKKGGWHYAEGLKLNGVLLTEAILTTTGRQIQFRPV